MKYCPHPLTWLNQKRWNDDMPELKQTMQEPGKKIEFEKVSAYQKHLDETKADLQAIFIKTIILPLKEELNEHSHRAFIEILRVMEHDEKKNELLLYHPDNALWVKNNYGETIKDLLDTSDTKFKNAKVIFTSKIRGDPDG